jgi:hypothetical protein
MLKVRTYAGPSPLHGLGLFAAEPIPSGTLIWRFETPDFAVREDEARHLSSDAQDLLRRHGFLHRGFWYLGADNDRFTNHSEDPNIGNGIEDSHGVYALRDIAAGEELLANYHEFDESADWKLSGVSR